MFGQTSKTPCSEIFYDSFEFNLDQWSQIGKECNRTKAFSSSGMYGIQLQDDAQLRSSISTMPLNLASYSSLRFSFQFTSREFEAQENFMLEVSMDGGRSFILQENWVHGIDFENGESIAESVDLTLDFTESTIFRIRCDASDNDDQLFIDDVLITDCPRPSGIEFSSTSNNSNINIIAINKTEAGESISLLSHPSDDAFTINMGMLKGKAGIIEIFNKVGAKLSRSVFDDNHVGQLTFPINYLEDGNYSVCVKSNDEKLYVLRLVVGS